MKKNEHSGSPSGSDIPSPLSRELLANMRNRENGMIRYHIAIQLKKSSVPRRELIIIGNCVSCLLFEHEAEVESVEMLGKYALICVLLSPKEAPADFAHAFADQCAHNRIPAGDRFYVSTGKKPSPEDIDAYMKKGKAQ